MKKFKKNFIWNTLGTCTNAFSSLFFMITVTRINGLNDAGIFTIAFSTACIIYIVGLYAGRIYQVTEPNKLITNKEYIFHKIITVFIMLVFVILFCIIREYNAFKTTVFILLTGYKAIEAFSESIYGILQKNENLDKVGKSLLLKSLTAILLFILINYITKNLIFSIVIIILTSIVITIFYDIRITKKYIDIKSKLDRIHIFNIFKYGFFTFIISFLGMYIQSAPKYSIDSYLKGEFQTIFGIIVMPATVMALFAQFLIHPFLNKILNVYEDNNFKELNKIIYGLVLLIFIFGAVSSMLAYFIGPEIIGFVYGIELDLYRVNLLIIIIAATLYTIGFIYSSILITIRDTFSQFIIYIILSIFALIVSNVLTKNYQVNGATYAYFLIMLLQFIIYTIYTNLKLKKIKKI